MFEQLGVGVAVGVLLGVGEGTGVLVGTGVSVGTGVKVSVGVGGVVKAAIGRPKTREVRYCSTIPVRCARRCMSGHTDEIMGALSGWVNSTVTITVSPVSPACSPGAHWETDGTFGSPAV